MRIETSDQTTSGIVHIQRMLRKIDRLRLPSTSRRDLESILVRQIARELDRLLPWQAGHAEHTAGVAFRIGQAAHLHNELLHQLTLAALLHDVGLLLLPTSLHTKQASLDPDSYVAIQSHPRLGATILEPFSFLHRATHIIAHHHEHWDGSGYPYGLRETMIPLGARILAVADAFDAIHVPNVFDPSLRHHIALRILRVGSGTQFDPSIVETFCTLMEEQPQQRVEQDPILSRTPACALRRSQSGTPTAPTLPAEAFASRWPQPFIDNKRVPSSLPNQAETPQSMSPDGNSSRQFFAHETDIPNQCASPEAFPFMKGSDAP